MAVRDPVPDAQSAARPPRDRRILLLILAVVLVAAGAAAGFLWSLAGPSPGTWSPAYGSARTLSASELASLNASATAGTAYAGNDSVWFSGGSVDLVVVLSPPEHDMTFIVQGLVNPTIHVRADARVTVTEVNLDPDMLHNWALTRTGPPYSSMPMMGPGAMMSMAMLSPPSGSSYWAETMSFTAVSGSYWYLCEYAGHAADGMYGSFVVG